MQTSGSKPPHIALRRGNVGLAILLVAAIGSYALGFGLGLALALAIGVLCEILLWILLLTGLGNGEAGG